MACVSDGSNYCHVITYPINPDEVRYVTESIYESIVMESGLDYLRDRFWHEDALEIVRTRSPLMKRVFELMEKYAIRKEEFKSPIKFTHRKEL